MNTCVKIPPIRMASRRAFTLIELLLVVTILGLIAAIVIPQFSDASAESRVNTLKGQLRQLRTQIELYKAQHGSVPNLTTNWDALTTATTGADGQSYGPYLLFQPRNPFNNSSAVVDGSAGAFSGNGGYLYDYSGGTGAIYGFDADGTTALTY